MRTKVIGAALLLLALSGCGFTPLYGNAQTQAGPQAALSQIAVALIPDRNGQMLRQDLQERLERDGTSISSHYDLYVTLVIYGNDIGIDQQSASTRSRQTGVAGWTLKAQDAAHTVIASGRAHSLDGFDVINQQFFAADEAREAAARRIDETLADQITQQLAVYFKTHKPAGT
jgi:LPS-assembly lipoprotein